MGGLDNALGEEQAPGSGEHWGPEKNREPGAAKPNNKAAGGGVAPEGRREGWRVRQTPTQLGKKGIPANRGEKSETETKKHAFGRKSEGPERVCGYPSTREEGSIHHPPPQGPTDLDDALGEEQAPGAREHMGGGHLHENRTCTLANQ